MTPGHGDRSATCSTPRSASTQLDSERAERGEVDQAEAAEQDRTHPGVSRAWSDRAPQNAGGPIGDMTMPGDEVVRGLGEHREEGGTLS